MCYTVCVCFCINSWQITCLHNPEIFGYKIPMTILFIFSLWVHSCDHCVQICNVACSHASQPYLRGIASNTCHPLKFSRGAFMYILAISQRTLHIHDFLSRQRVHKREGQEFWHISTANGISEFFGALKQESSSQKFCCRGNLRLHEW